MLNDTAILGVIEFYDDINELVANPPAKDK